VLKPSYGCKKNLCKNAPEGHARQSAAERLREYASEVDAGHSTHAVEAEDSWYVPGPHGAHADAPGSAEKVPGEHATHCSADDAPPKPRNVPPGQSAHVSVPGSDAYDPGAHASHLDAPSTGAARPGGHGEHAVALRSSAKAPVAQTTQSPVTLGRGSIMRSDDIGAESKGVRSEVERHRGFCVGIGSERPWAETIAGRESKVLKERRSPRRRGRMGTGVR
jgi:hypothetical protein